MFIYGSKTYLVRIDREKCKWIFDSFYRVDDARSQLAMEQVTAKGDYFAMNSQNMKPSDFQWCIYRHIYLMGIPFICNQYAEKKILRLGINRNFSIAAVCLWKFRRI